MTVWNFFSLTITNLCTLQHFLHDVALKLEVLVFVGIKVNSKTQTKKYHRATEDNKQQQTQRVCEAKSGNWTRPTI